MSNIIVGVGEPVTACLSTLFKLSHTFGILYRTSTNIINEFSDAVASLPASKKRRKTYLAIRKHPRITLKLIAGNNYQLSEVAPSLKVRSHDHIGCGEIRSLV